ncbi:hypothetical protein HJC23_000483 [Cyclotella cryptica]|uniref:FAD-binding PCMH-type domain-containing protein n=1 Tax=Cyclotella cryptica TaxID=29204 RepID=A0ABD3QG67_9STRA
MFPHALKQLLFLLICGFATVIASGSSSDKCVPVGGKGLSDDVPVDCGDAVSSFDSIIERFFGGGASFGGAVLSALDGTAYNDASKQYASARVPTAPSFIVQATNQVDVQAAIMFAVHCEYKVTARSGGHSYIGSSSCDGSEMPCIQIDVGNISHIDVTVLPNGSKQINVGPGVRLDELYPVLIDNDVYIPAGECGGVGVGGHMQTGGFGIFGRSLGRFNSHIAAFDIILADGSLVSVSSPQNNVTSKLNDDLWYAVIGGASGSFGVIVDITFIPINESDHFAFYWEVSFFYSNSTKHCMQNMVQEFAKMLEDESFTNDMRWNIMFSIAGYKTLFSQDLHDKAFNFAQLDFTWVENGSSDRAQSFSEAQAIYNRLFEAYTFQGSDSTCLTLDQYFETLGEPFTTQLKTKFGSTYATADDAKSMSTLHKEVTLVDWGALGLEKKGVPFTSSYQQGPQYPQADDLVKVFDLIDELMPENLTHQRLVLSQFGVLPGPSNVISNVAQPFQEDVFGVVVDVWSFDKQDYTQDQRKLQDLVISSVGGVDHRMFWAAYEDTCLECGAWEKYYESLSKYNELRRIKGCVDPNNVFKFRMSIPGMRKSDDGMSSKTAKAKSEKRREI